MAVRSPTSESLATGLGMEAGLQTHIAGAAHGVGKPMAPTELPSDHKT